jgi:hypothetical protein
VPIVENSSTAFYEKAGTLLESLAKQMQAQQDRLDLELLDSPDKKAMKKQMFKLRMAERSLVLEEIEAKRRKLAETIVPATVVLPPSLEETTSNLSEPEPIE